MWRASTARARGAAHARKKSKAVRPAPEAARAGGVRWRAAARYEATRRGARRGAGAVWRARRSPKRRAARTRRCAGSGGRGSARAQGGGWGGGQQQQRRRRRGAEWATRRSTRGGGGTRAAQEKRAAVGPARAREAARTYTKVAVGSGWRTETLTASARECACAPMCCDLRARNEMKSIDKCLCANAHTHTRVEAKAESAEADGDVPPRFFFACVGSCTL